ASSCGFGGRSISLPATASSGRNRAANPSAVTVLSGPQVRSCRLARLRRFVICVNGGCSHATSVAPSTESPFLSRLALHTYMFHCSQGTPRSHGQVMVV